MSEIKSEEFNILQEEFVLYDELYDVCCKYTEFTRLQDLMPLLRRLDQKGLQIVGLLVKKHSLASSEVPYNGMSLNSQDVKFDIRNFDPVLQNILLEFCTRYLSIKN